MKKLLLAFLLIFPSISFATQTETITSGEVGTLGIYKQIVHTASAANEFQCVDARGWDGVYVGVDISGTISYDIDSALTGEAVSNEPAFGIALAAALTADAARSFTQYGAGTPTGGAGSIGIFAPYICIDINSCTTCTLTATWYLFSKKPF